MATTFLPIDCDYRIEYRRIAAEPAANQPAHLEPLDVVDCDGQSIDNEDLFDLARDLCAYEGDDVAEALDALLGYALDAERAEGHAERADALDVDLDEPIPYELVDPPGTSDPAEQWIDWPIPFDVIDLEGCLGSDPEAPDPWRMDDDGVDAFAAEYAEYQRSLTGRVLRALGRAAGGSR